MHRVCLIAFLTSVASPALAEVTGVSDVGFTTTHHVTTSLEPAAAYDLLIRPGEWWNMDHTYTGEAANLSLEANASGCFCEALADGGSVEHLRVVYVEPGKAVRFSGGLGPLQPLGVAGAMSWTIEPSDNGSVVRFDYAVGGFVDGGFAEWAPAVDGVVSGQLDHFKQAADEAAAN